MPRYRVSVWSKSRPNIRTTKIVVKRSITNAVQQATLIAAQLQYSAHLKDGDMSWSVERMSGHLNMWIIAAHSKDRQVTGHAATY